MGQWGYKGVGEWDGGMPMMGFGGVANVAWVFDFAVALFGREGLVGG